MISDLEQVSVKQEVLLIVSGDHGFRLLKSSPDDSRTVPWLAWRVGSHDGQVVKQPISTVHTAALIEDFLNNKVSNQDEISAWWQGKPVLPRLTVAPKNDND